MNEITLEEFLQMLEELFNIIDKEETKKTE
jgi:hypothetical protein